MKDIGKIADAFNNFFPVVTENLNIQQTGKQDAVTFLKDSFLRKFLEIQLIPTTEAE